MERFWSPTREPRGIRLPTPGTCRHDFCEFASGLIIQVSTYFRTQAVELHLSMPFCPSLDWHDMTYWVLSIQTALRCPHFIES